MKARRWAPIVFGVTVFVVFVAISVVVLGVAWFREHLEIQVRQMAIQTAGPLGPNGYTGLTSCVSINSAVAVRAAGHRVTYQPNASGKPDPEGLELRIDGHLVALGREPVQPHLRERILIRQRDRRRLAAPRP